MSHRICYVVSALLLAILGLGWSVMEPTSTGTDMSRAAQKFLETLTEQQRDQTLMDYETPQRVAWHFIPKSERKGLQIKNMSKPQREAAHGLLRAALSEVGYDKAVTIMALEQVLHELEKQRSGGNIRDAERFYFTVFGPPQEQGRWGLSVEGHHLSLNFVVQDGNVISSTPAFMGANPALLKNQVPGGVPQGTRVLAKEELLAFELVHALSDEQREKALIAEKALREIRQPGSAQPPREAAVGLPAGEMTAAQKQMFRSLVQAYLANMPEEVREARIEAIRAGGTDNVHFAWAGPTEPGIGHYYRVQGPSFLIEFVNTQPDAAGNPANHIHCVWRDMQGDFAIPIDR
jgi:hypothetical protein